MNILKIVNTMKFYFFMVWLTKGSSATKEDHIKINYKTLKNCLDSMRKYNKIPGKIIFASTISVYVRILKKKYIMRKLV